MENLQIIDDIARLFSDRIISLVGYGSYFFDRMINCNDVDLCLLLDTRESSDFYNLNKIIKGDVNNVDITVHYLDELEERGWDNFTHGTHGIFFLKHLGHAKVLIGNDIFARKSSLIPKRKYFNSLIDQINQYIDRIQTKLINESHDLTGYYQKYTTRILIDILLIASQISFREINNNSTIEITKKFISRSSVLSGKTKNLHNELLTGTALNEQVAELLKSLSKDLQEVVKKLDHDN